MNEEVKSSFMPFQSVILSSGRARGILFTPEKSKPKSRSHCVRKWESIAGVGTDGTDPVHPVAGKMKDDWHAKSAEGKGVARGCRNGCC